MVGSGSHFREGGLDSSQSAISSDKAPGWSLVLSGCVVMVAGGYVPLERPIRWSAEILMCFGRVKSKVVVGIFPSQEPRTLPGHLWNCDISSYLI